MVYIIIFIHIFDDQQALQAHLPWPCDWDPPGMAFP